jgi:hypothetical protein
MNCIDHHHTLKDFKPRTVLNKKSGSELMLKIKI